MRGLIFAASVLSVVLAVACPTLRGELGFFALILFGIANVCPKSEGNFDA